MINIEHPKIRGKPPAKGSSLGATECKRKEMPEDSDICRKGEAIEDPVGRIKADRNRSIVESTACSFEQLCSMISDLERDMTGELPRVDQLQLEPERDEFGGKVGTNATTYDDIMSLLTEMEDSNFVGSPDEGKMSVPEADHAILGEMFGESRSLASVSGYDRVGPGDVRYAFEEDLATARLQLEEKSAAVRLLKEQLKSERKLAYEKLENQKRRAACELHQQEEKYKGVVKRHQKFIEQLISEKTDLTEKCTSLAQKVNQMEIKMQRDSRAASDRQAVELQRAKERFAAAEKIKRERWIEARTSKIKEMTVKGLEPELRGMMEQHAEEIQRLRNVHAKELQDAELRIVRLSNQQLEQLRLELTASHERMLASEKSILCARYQEKLAEQESEFETRQTKLAEEVRRDREKVEAEQAKLDAEREASLQRMHAQCQRETEILRQQHSKEKVALGESLKTEWEAWLADYKRQQNSRVEQGEQRIRDECSRERDRQIELAIQRLEKDSRNAKLALQRTFDCKLRSLKENFQMDLQAATDGEQLCRGKLAQTKDKLEETEAQLRQAERKLKESALELRNANEATNRLSAERDDARKLARQEIEGEKRLLEEKIASLYQEITRTSASRDASMAQLHSRIKLIAAQKVAAINNLRKELGDAKSRCEHLEKLLDQQRKEYILKSS